MLRHSEQLHSAAGPLRLALARAGFTQRGVQELLGASESGFADLSSLPLVLWRTRVGSPLATLVRLFVAGADVPEAQAAEALAPLTLEHALRAGLLAHARQADDGSHAAHVRAELALVPFDDLVTAADFSQRPQGPVEPAADHVMGVGRSSVSLARLVLGATGGCSDAPRRWANVLDLGCGGGFLALRSASRAQRVIGTDINPRAIGLARFSARLNDPQPERPGGLPQVEFRPGSLFEPVAGETFDLVLSNPPFVISPESGLMYRDGAAGPSHASEQRSGQQWGDEFCSAIASRASDFLTPGGMHVMLINVACSRATDWNDRVREWVGAGVQAWAIRTDTQPVDQYASMWIRHTASGRPDWSPAQFSRAFDRWMQYYDARGVTHIAYGALAIRRALPAFFDATHIESRWIEAGAVDVPRGLDGRSLCASLPTDADASRQTVLGRPWVLAPDARAVRTSVSSPRSTSTHEQVTFTCAMERPIVSVPPAAADVILRCTGARPLGVLVDEAASVTGLSRQAITEHVMAGVMPLLTEGMLHAAG